MPIKDSRYATVRILIEQGKIHSIIDILQHIPPSILAKDMHTEYYRFKKLLEKPDQFTLDEMHRLADIIECDFMQVFIIIFDEVIRIKAE